jgi:tetratricopeptide (TPR) repeat protein
MNIRRQNWIRTIFVSFSSLMCIFSNQPTAAYTTTTQLQTSLDRMIQQMQGVPDDIAKLQQQAALEAYLKQHAEAVADLTHILTLDPRNLWALSTRSYEYLALKKNEEALADANSALQLCKGKRANYLLQRASCFYMLSKDEEAAKDCTELLEKCPDATQTEKLVAYSNRAEVFYRLGKYNDCLSDCTRTIEIDPRGSGGAAYYWRGQALKALKDDVGAAAATIKSNELGYVDTGREIIATNALVYQNMLDPVQKQFSHRIDTRHFAFFFNTDEALAKEIAKFSECFLSHVKADLMEFDWDAPVNVYMMPDRESQHKFLKEQMKWFWHGWAHRLRPVSWR